MQWQDEVAEGAAWVLARAFADQAPLDVCRNITADEWIATSRPAVQCAINLGFARLEQQGPQGSHSSDGSAGAVDLSDERYRGLSHVAVLERGCAAPEVVGVALRVDLAMVRQVCGPFDGEPLLKLQPILELLHGLELELERRAAAASGSAHVALHTLYVWLVGVDRQVGGRGIGRQLLRMSEDVARRCGFAAVAAVATNALTGRVCQSLGWREEARQEYASFRSADGHLPFALLPDVLRRHGLPPVHTAASVVYKEL
jgi:GNAT superfamily N-acetyltransferase